jgi:hypothetical protein
MMFSRIFFRGFICLMLIISAMTGIAQYSNSWINFNQKYYRIPVVQDGIYRIDYSALAASGVAVNTIDPRQIQIFHLGEEQYIYVHGENDGIFHSGDFIEFFGKRNTAQADLPLFSDPAHLANPNFSFFNDTASYYLTVTSGINNRRIVPETDVNFIAYNSFPYVWKTARQDYTSSYFSGKTNFYGLTNFEYTENEGWFDVPFAINPSTPGVATTITRSIPTPQVYTAGPAATIDLKVVGASNFLQLTNDHHLVIQIPGKTIDTIYEGYTTIHITENVNPILLGTSNTTLTFTLPNDLGSGADRNTISYIQVKYPHTTHMENLQKMMLHLPVQSGQKSVLQLGNINFTQGDSVIVYDFAGNKRIRMHPDGNVFKGIIQNNSQEKQIYFSTGNQIVNIQSLSPVNQNVNSGFFTDYSSPQYSDVDYIIITHSSLMNACNQYATYRSGKGYNVLLVDIKTLYEQFGFGIAKHPLGVKNFIVFALDHFADTIHGLFLVGKGYKSGEGPYSYRNNSAIYNLTLVPSMGNPPSDNMFSAKINNNSVVPAIPTGRLSAKTNSDVLIYLNKIIDHENAQIAPYNPSFPTEKEWMKNVLHFAGGSNANQGVMLETFLNIYRDSLVNPYFGAAVKTFKKNTTDPMQQVVSDSLRNLINNGVSMLNFFGHAAGIGFDISIDNPSEYNNYQKYFFILANSCLSGDLFQPEQTSSEAFVMIQNKGAIGYLGSTINALADFLHLYSRHFVGGIARSNYGNSIGSSMKRAMEIIDDPTNEYINEISYSMALHGDPVIKINPHQLPDYVLIPSAITFQPPIVTTETDSFQVVIVSKNIGKAVEDNFTVELTRTYPDNTTETYVKLVPATTYADTLIFTLPVDLVKGVGLNIFSATLDAYFNIDESVETNNSAIKQLLITSSDIIPVYPYEFAVVPEQTVTLVASTGNPFASMNTYFFEVDTTDSFNSPFKQTGQVSSAGGLIEWTVPFPMSSMPDSTVYYWRTSAAGGTVWRESSFQFIQGKKGWGQAHFFQFKKNNYNRIKLNLSERSFQFDTASVWISAQTGFYDAVLNPTFQWFDIWYKVNGIIKGNWSCTNYNGNGMKFAVFDPLTIEPWMSKYDGSGIGPFGNLHCRNYDWFDFDYFTFRPDPAEQNEWHMRMVSLLDTVPAGHYVLAFSHRNHNAQNYPEALYQAFETIGSGYIRNIENNKPYMIFGRKGDPTGTADESIGASLTSVIKNDYYLSTNFNSGSVASPLIGPASGWSSLHWRIESYEPANWTDTTRLFVLGQSTSGIMDTLLGPLSPIAPELDISNLDQLIDAAQYPFLQLYLTTTDENLLTPSQLVRWHVMYEGVPETAISPNIHFTFVKDTVQEGDMIRMSIATKNISRYDFPDSLMVDYYVLTSANQILSLVRNKKISLHPSAHIITDSVSFSTFGMRGLNSLWVEFNPVDTTTHTYHQTEQYHYNNIAQIPFFVQKDISNPLLDVTFDGVRILEGDIVSANPNIQVMLKDENRFLLLTDTTVFRVFLQRPGTEIERIYFVKNNQEQMFFFPATSPSNNTARIEFPATFPIDGTYKLRVQASDISQNESGDVDYIISFRVINKSTITEVMNWPNPFSTRTHFVFTLTGSVIPDYFKIQIMTITGKVVREIDMAELGPIHIGRNITQYAWDGRDQFGDQLANGVYLYRVVTKISGQDIELNQTPASQYFTKEFGKMVLMR